MRIERFSNPVIATFFLCGVSFFNVHAQGFGIGVPAPTAMLHLQAGTATANTAPLKLTSGTNLTTAEAGAVEYDGTNFYMTPASTRYTVMLGFNVTTNLNFPNIAAAGGSQELTVTVTGAAVGDNCFCTPNTTIEASITWNCWVSAANTVRIRAFSSTGGVDQAARNWRVTVIK